MPAYCNKQFAGLALSAMQPTHDDAMPTTPDLQTESNKSTPLRSLQPLQPLQPLRYGGALDTQTSVLYCGHNAGFFSNCSVVLWNLADIQRKQLPLPQRIDFSRAFSSYRNATQREQGTDLYPLFFAADARVTLPAGPALPDVKHHGLYRWLDYKTYTPWMQRYFAPSPHVQAIAAQLMQKYGIDLAKTIAVVYRGTDKGIEVRLASPAAYLEQARKLLRRHPGYRLLIQTDELAVRTMFTQTLGPDCFFIAEMPVSGGGAVVHDLDDQALSMDRSEFGCTLIAVTHLISQCALIVNHTGNMALWICLYRGHAGGLVQFDEAGSLVDLTSPGFYLRKLGWFVGKVKRKLGLGSTRAA
jgi:hypothetical protein